MSVILEGVKLLAHTDGCCPDTTLTQQLLHSRLMVHRWINFLTMKGLQELYITTHLRQKILKKTLNTVTEYWGLAS